MKRILLLGIFLANSYDALAANAPAPLATSATTGDRSQMKEETLSPFFPDLEADPTRVSGIGALTETRGTEVCSTVISFSRGS